MLPAVADQVTALLLEPFTVAVNCCVPPAGSEAETGEILIFAATAVIGEHAERYRRSNSERFTDRRFFKVSS